MRGHRSIWKNLIVPLIERDLFFTIMIKNIYFIIKKPSEAIDSILKHTVEKGVDKTRISNDGNFAVVKLHIGAEIPASMQNLKAYSNSEILEVLNTDPNWKGRDL